MNSTPGLLATFVLALAVVASAAAAMDREKPENSADVEFYPLALNLVWYDAYNLLPHSFETMSHEVNRIFGECGVDLRWEMGLDDPVNSIDRDPLRVNVVLLPSSSSSWGFHEKVMGVATHREGAKGSVYIFFPELIRTLGLDRRMDDLSTPWGMRRLALAMGRVVSHELVHVLAPHHPHTTSGLMKSQLTRKYLARSQVHLDRPSALVVRGVIQAKADRVLLASRGSEIGEKVGDEDDAPQPSPPISIYESPKMR